jgi:hypothetical protein
LGAGFNVDAAKEAGPIYGNSIYERYQIDCAYPLVADALALCFGVDQVPSGRSIEDLFLEALQHNDYVPFRKLYRRLMEADFRLAAKLASGDGSNSYKEFFRTFPDANFLTFNYDSLPEIFLFKLGRWNPHDGYGLSVETEVGPLSPGGFAPGKSKPLVLHLHGSFSVYSREFEITQKSGETIPWLEPLEHPSYGFDPDSITLCFPPYRRAMSNTGHVSIEERVIAPIPDKVQELKRPFINESYRKACSLVRESGVLIAVGYSFNRHDKASYGRILESLAKSTERKLVVVSPDANESAIRIRQEYPVLRVTPIGKTFKHWAADSFRC